MPFHIIREILIVMFLNVFLNLANTKKPEQNITHLVAHRAHEILHRLSIVFTEPAQVIQENLVEPTLPISTNDIKSASL
jgi:hypothetical protein